MFYHRSAFLGSPGAGKSTAGLSYPGVEQHVFGSSEEDTAIAFSNRTDILPAYKPEWFDTLKEEEQAKFYDDAVDEREIASLTKLGRARNIAKYRRYLYKLKADLNAGRREELKSVFLDNFTPFALEFQDYVELTYAAEFETKEGNFNSIKFSMRYQQEISDFLRFFVSLPCHTLVSCHIAMSVDEETAAKVDFMKDTQKGIKHQKEWQPLIMGKSKFVFAGIFTWAFFMATEQNPGLATKYYAKLEADDSVVGVAKSRMQPFKNPRRIDFPQYKFYETLNSAVEEYRQTGEPVANPVVTR